MSNNYIYQMSDTCPEVQNCYPNDNKRSFTESIINYDTLFWTPVELNLTILFRHFVDKTPCLWTICLKKKKLVRTTIFFKSFLTVRDYGPLIIGLLFFTCVLWITYSLFVFDTVGLICFYLFDNVFILKWQRKKSKVSPQCMLNSTTLPWVGDLEMQLQTW